MAELRDTDYIQQLVNYIKRNLAKGYTIDSLKWALLSQDYSRSAVERAIKLANEQLAKQAPILKEKPKIKYEIITDKESVRQVKKRGFLYKLRQFFK